MLNSLRPMNKPVHSSIPAKPMLRLLVTFCCLMLAKNLVCSAAVVVYVNEQGNLVGFSRPEVSDPVAALNALATPPPGLVSAVPAGTAVEGYSLDEAGATVAFSKAITNLGMDDLRLETIFEQVRATLMQFGIEGTVRLQSDGRLLSDYLSPTPQIVLLCYVRTTLTSSNFLPQQ